MREADMKCKVAMERFHHRCIIFPHHPASHLHLSPIADRVTRSRKLAAEDAFRCELTVSVSFQEGSLRSYLC